jgi:hypothetical protein
MFCTLSGVPSRVRGVLPLLGMADLLWLVHKTNRDPCLGEINSCLLTIHSDAECYYTDDN